MIFINARICRIFTGLCIVFYGTVRAETTRIVRDKDYTAVFHYFCAPTLQERVVKNIDRLFNGRDSGTVSARFLADELHTLYPCIAHVRISYQTAENTHIPVITVDMQRPCALINDLFILTNTGELVPKEYYRMRVRETCFTCTVHDCIFSLLRADKEGARNFVRFVENLHPHIREVYDCYWHDPTLIYFAHKFEPTVIKADCSTRFDERLLQAINRVRSYCAFERDRRERRINNGKRTIDVRCKNQLIFAACKEG